MPEDKQPNTTNEGMSRRNFLKNSGLVAGGLIGGSLFGGLVTNQFQKGSETKEETKSAGAPSFEARTFFSRNEDFDVLSAATERIYPEDDLGPGAIGLGVPYFIDRQCSSEWGTNANDYMFGPFPLIDEVNEYVENNKNIEEVNAGTQVTVPSATPRYQTKMTRGTLFLEGVRALEAESQKSFNERFIKIEPAQQDEILQKFEAGEVDIAGTKSYLFFSLLRQTTIEGVYADPVYGGNRDMEAWKMKGHPGPRMSWLDKIEEEEFLTLKPESLRNYQGH